MGAQETQELTCLDPLWLKVRKVGLLHKQRGLVTDNHRSEAGSGPLIVQTLSPALLSSQPCLSRPYLFFFLPRLRACPPSLGPVWDNRCLRTRVKLVGQSLRWFASASTDSFLISLSQRGLVPQFPPLQQARGSDLPLTKELQET